MPIAQVDFARRAGVARSTISRAFNGPLRAALLASKRVDATHPLVVTWARARGLDPVVLLGPSVAIVRGRAEAGHLGAEAPDDDLVLAPDAGMPTQEFADRAEVNHREVLLALSAELEPALLPNGRIEPLARAALEFMSARPFRTDDPADEPKIDGEDFLASAASPDPDHPGAVVINTDHPAFWVWLARKGVPIHY